MSAVLMAASMPRASLGSGVSLTEQFIEKIGAGSVTVTGSYLLDNDGTVRDHTNAILETWLAFGLNSDFEARATKQSGSNPTTGTLNTWLALSSDRIWTMDGPAGFVTTTTLLIEIRDVATSTVQDSAVIIIQVDNT